MDAKTKAKISKAQKARWAAKRKLPPVPKMTADMLEEALDDIFVGTSIEDPVNHPSHYTSHPSGVECIQVTEHFNFNVGNAIKYLWRAGQKGDYLEQLRKAEWYVAREIARVSK